MERCHLLQCCLSATTVFNVVVPSEPVLAYVKLRNDTSMSVSWTQPNRPNGRITHYEIIWLHNKTEHSAFVNDTTYDITGLGTA